MTITSSTPSTSVTPDLLSGDAPNPVASIADTVSSINSTLRSAGRGYSEYQCKSVSWDDVTRGSVGGSLSCWGSNITDTRLYEKSGKQLYTVRSENWNEKLGKVSADELALITGNQQSDGQLKPVTLRDFLKDIGTHGSYAGLDKSVSLADRNADDEVSIRFMTTFLPVADESLATLEFAPEMYQYQTRSEKDPANLLLLATTQGVAVQANGQGATKLYHHYVEPSKKINRYWFEAERSNKQVGGAQHETKEEQLAAAKRGKATASVIGTRSMGTRFNVLMTIQVPLKQQPPPQRRVPSAANFKSAKKGFGGGGFFGMGMGSGGGQWGGGSMKSMQFTKSMAVDGAEDELGDGFACAEEFCDSEDEEEFMGFTLGSAFGGAGPPPVPCAAAPPPTLGGVCRSMSRASRTSMPPRPRVGTANAARVSRGSLVDKLDKTVHIAKPTRDPSQHVTVTVVIYNTVAGGVPSAEDVRAAIDDMEQLYASCGWKGRLADDGASFMKKELTVKDTMDISDKLANQPYVPPAAQNLVLGGDLFPTSSGAA